MNNNQKFFKGMYSFSTAMLVVGILISVISFFAVASITQGNILVSILVTATAILSTIAIYYILKGIALTGYKVHEEKEERITNITTQQPKE